MKAVLAAWFAALMLASSAQAAPISYFANLSGLNEAPPNNSPGTGFTRVTIDVVAHTLLVDVVFSGLVAPNTAAHIHCCTTVPFTATAGVATSVPTFTGFPGGTTSGSYINTFDLTLASSYNPAFVTAQGGIAAAEAALAAGMAQGRTYLNIHSSTFPGGEIRGFLEPVPEPATMLIAGAALLGLAAIRRKAQVG
jgi:hypothetical protein